MNQKRKAAANVFMEQQQLDEAPDGAQAPAFHAAPPSVGIPQQQAPGGGVSPPSPAMGMPARPEPPRPMRSRVPQDGLKTSEELQLEKEPIRIRETGLWFWRR